MNQPWKIFAIFFFILMGFAAAVKLGVSAGVAYGPVVGLLIALSVLVLLIFAAHEFKARYLEREEIL